MVLMTPEMSVVTRDLLCLSMLVSPLMQDDIQIPTISAMWASVPRSSSAPIHLVPSETGDLLVSSGTEGSSLQHGRHMESKKATDASSGTVHFSSVKILVYCYSTQYCTTLSFRLCLLLLGVTGGNLMFHDPITEGHHTSWGLGTIILIGEKMSWVWAQAPCQVEQSEVLGGIPLVSRSSYPICQTSKSLSRQCSLSSANLGIVPGTQQGGDIILLVPDPSGTEIQETAVQIDITVLPFNTSSSSLDEATISEFSTLVPDNNKMYREFMKRASGRQLELIQDNPYKLEDVLQVMLDWLYL